jgi:hypothetical protein
MSGDGLYLGTNLDGGGRVVLDADHLTTHAVCVGMTGSGKTGLGIVALEELARRGTPLLVVDLKGDMVDLLLTFPGLDGPSFAPWVPVEEVGERDRVAVAAEVAARWQAGLETAGLGGEDIAAVRSGVEWRLVTPGASASPLDILPSLAAPAAGVDLSGDAVRDRVDGVVSGLLSLVGRGGDPLTDRDHVLLASVVLDAWKRGSDLDLEALVRTVADPPFDALGALPLESFYGRDDRMKLVMALNTLLASPAFGVWTRGTPLTMEALLGAPGAPRATILSVAHLDERQRLFVLALVASELVAWMRRQPASSGLRALLYMDEVTGILPPHPANPPTKTPLLTLLKQGRAFGVGAWLATQNPVDLDYKAVGNAGVQLIGRLITERDRDRALDGLGLRELGDGRRTDEVVAGLGKREFVLVDVRSTPRVRTLASRWAMSYLRGPVTLPEMGPLVAEVVSAPSPDEPPDGPRTADSGAAQPPLMNLAVDQRYVAGLAGSASPWVVVESRVHLERKGIGLDRDTDEVWRFSVDPDGRIDWEAAQALDGVPELVSAPPPEAVFPAVAPARLEDELDGVEREFVAWRARRASSVLANPALDLVADVGESREAFLARCLELADRADDIDQERAKARFEKRMDTLRRRLDRERDELDRDRTQLESRRAEEKLGMVEGLFSVLLGSKSARSAAGKLASRARTTATKRRMRQRAEGAVVESEHEIERIEAQLEDLADEMQAEIDRIAAESEAMASRVEEVAVRPTRTRVEVRGVTLVWG